MMFEPKQNKSFLPYIDMEEMVWDLFVHGKSNVLRIAFLQMHRLKAVQEE